MDSSPTIHQFERVPKDLQTEERWLVFCLEPKPNKPGEFTKPPRSVHTGKYCDHTDPASWATFAQAVTYCQQHAEIDGVGFMLTGDDDISGVDFDDCIDDDGNVAAWAQAYVDELDSYTEISPSGRGLRIFTRGDLPPGKRRTGNVEMYDCDRYLTVTGNHLPGTPTTINERTDALGRVHRRIFGADRQEELPQEKRAQRPAISLDDSQVLQRMRGARNWPDIERLMNGEHEGDASAADQALCNHLAFWTGRDAAQMDRIFRQSDLYRDKWDKQHRGDGATYGQMTIERAIADTRNTYSGASPDPAVGLVFAADADEATRRFFLKQGADDTGNARCVHYLHGQHFAYSTALGWVGYTGTHWQNGDSEFAVNRAVTETLIQRRVIAASAGEGGEKIVKATKPTATNKRNVKEQFRDLVVVGIGEFDSDPDVLNCANGVINLRSGQLLTHEPSNRFTYCVPIDYRPDSDSGSWQGFLADVVKDYTEIEEWLQMACGYSLTG